jgi:hypothetical protein
MPPQQGFILYIFHTLKVLNTWLITLPLANFDSPPTVYLVAKIHIWKQNILSQGFLLFENKS